MFWRLRKEREGNSETNRKEQKGNSEANQKSGKDIVRLNKSNGNKIERQGGNSGAPKSSSRYIAEGAVIAALYVVLTILFAPISFGAVQIRVAEALSILPLFTVSAVPGLFIGCLLANILGGGILPDIVIGSIATLLGAAGGYLLRRNRWLVPIPSILANTILIPPVLRYGYGVNMPILLPYRFRIFAE